MSWLVAAGTSALDMASATRVYWTFKVLGHDRVSILDGGHRAYAADPANPLERGWMAPRPTSFTATLRPELIADRTTVESALGGDQALVDLRPPPQYRGKVALPIARKGTIPGAGNVPESRLTGPDGRFVSATQVETLLAEVGVASGESQIMFCNTGHWASLGWFASRELAGNDDVKLYDGSMVDWSADARLPVEVKAEQ